VFALSPYLLAGGGEKVKKVVLMSTIALLTLATMIISPVKAITKAPYWEHVEFNPADFDQPGKQWISEEGVLHVKDWHWVGTYEGTLGTGTMDVWFEQISLDLATGEGTLSGKWLVTIPDVGTIAGSARGKITAFVFGSGTFAGTHGTGMFEGVKKMGSFNVNMASVPYTIDASGTIIYP